MSELNHYFPNIIKQWPVAFCSIVEKKITTFLKLTINIFMYEDVGNEYINIQANCLISYILRKLRAILDPFRLKKSTLYLRKVTSRKVQLTGGKRDRIPRMDMFCKFLTASPGIKLILMSRLEFTLLCSLAILTD